MKKTRLNKLVQHLYKVGADIASGKLVDKFDMSTWGELEEQGKFKNRKDMSCMTAACAIGHAGTVFKAEGFQLQLDELELDDEGNVVSGGEFVVPYYKGLYEIDAVAKFFDITVEEAEFLFMPDQYFQYDALGCKVEYNPGPGAVADRIRRFIAEA